MKVNQTTEEGNMRELQPHKLYTAKQIIKAFGLRRFQDLKAIGRIDWVQDNSFGDKLYRVNQ